MLHPSPNFGPRKNGLKPGIVVIHYTAMQNAEAALERLCDPKAEVSAHYLITRAGQTIKLVEEDFRAWHAGHGEWHGLQDINSRSIGIELDNTGRRPFPEPQMASLEILLSGIMARHAIRPADVIGHSDMAPGRKHDPGPLFDWARLAAKGLAAPAGDAPGPRKPSIEDFRKAARSAGYTADADDYTLLTAVRLRFRQGATGPLEPEDFTPLGSDAMRT